MRRAARLWRSARERTAQALLAAYKGVVSPLLHSVAGAPGACRYQPTCSEYAAIAIAEHGALRGGAMALGRVLRCNPLNRLGEGGGFDPVPGKAELRAQGREHRGEFLPEWAELEITGAQISGNR